MSSTSQSAKGGCLCGGVRYEARGPLRPVIACHCSQCAKTSGNFVAATSVARSGLMILSSRSLRWYRSSAMARRGFCDQCGGNLFWQEDGSDTTSIMAGTLDPPTGLETILHVFVGGKSDFYKICDGAPQKQAW